jgi:hypothetical protein
VKKINYFFLTLLLLPYLCDAAIVVPTANLTIVVNTGAHNEGLFHFVVSKKAGIFYVPYDEFDLQTVDHTAAKFLELDLFGSNQFLITQENDNGTLQNVTCDDPNAVVNPHVFGFFIAPQPDTTSTCTFDNNTDASSSKTPVLIIPGVLGTEISKDELLWANPKMANPLVLILL